MTDNDLLHSSQFILVKKVWWLNWLQLEANFSQRAGMWDGGLPSLSAGEVGSEQCWATERVLCISKKSKFYISIEILYWACSTCYQECISCCCSENAKLFGKENFPYSEAAFFSSILWQNQTEGKVSFWKNFPKVVSGNPLIGGGYLDNSECAGKKGGLKTGLLHQVGIPEVDMSLQWRPSISRSKIYI